MYDFWIAQSVYLSVINARISIKALLVEKSAEIGIENLYLLSMFPKILESTAIPGV